MFNENFLVKIIRQKILIIKWASVKSAIIYLLYNIVSVSIFV